MPPVRAPAAVATSAEKDRSTKRDDGVRQRLGDQTSQFRSFLDNYTENGLPFPAQYGKGKIVVPALLMAAGLSPRLAEKSPEFRTIAEQYAGKVGVTTVAEFQAKLPPPVPAALPRVTGMTYQQLFDLNAATLKLKNPKSLTSYQSALDRYMKFANKNRTDQTGAELAGGYEQTLQMFVQKYYDGDLKKAKSAKSYINKYQQVVARHQRTDGLPDSLHAALEQLVEQDGRSPGDLSEAIGQHRQFMSYLMMGRQKAVSIEVLTRLEALLRVEADTLTLRAVRLNPRHRPDFCPADLFPLELQGPETRRKDARGEVRKWLPDNFPSLHSTEQQRLLTVVLDDVLNKRHQSEFGRMIGKATVNPYLLKPDQMTPRLSAELDDHCRMKYTRGSMAKGKKIRDKVWKAAKAGKDGTEHRWRTSMYGFFGWCLLPEASSELMLKGAGMTPAELTLGLILVPALIAGYVQFRNARAGGKDTKTCELFLTACLSLLQAGHGWIEGHPELLDRMPDAFQSKLKQDGSTWQIECIKQFANITEINGELDTEVSRKSFEPIQVLIDTGRPMDLVQRALDNNWKELQAEMQGGHLTAREKALMYRDHVLISLIAALPLRASHWYGMTHRPNVRTLTSRDDGELRYVDDKHWALYLRAADFKNSKNKAIFGPNGDRDLTLLFHEHSNAFADLEPLVDEYMRVHRPLLCAGNGPVFPSTNGEALTGIKLRRIVINWTRRYISEHGDHRYGLRIVGAKPYGPHAFRHLMACHILKTTGKVEDAANMLLDSIEMILKHYGQFLPSDRLTRTFKLLDISRAVRTAI